MSRHSKITYWVVAAIGVSRLQKSYVKMFYTEEQAVSFARTVNCAAQKFAVFKREETEDLIWDGSAVAEGTAAGSGA